jgi:hypothetical protein
MEINKNTTTVHKEREQLGDQKNVGESSCNSGDGTGQMAQPLMFMMTEINFCSLTVCKKTNKCSRKLWIFFIPEFYIPQQLPTRDES